MFLFADNTNLALDGRVVLCCVVLLYLFFHTAFGILLLLLFADTTNLTLDVCVVLCCVVLRCVVSSIFVIPTGYSYSYW